MVLFRIVGFCFLVCNFQFFLASSDNPYTYIVNTHGSFYCLDQAARRENIEIFTRFLEAGADKNASHGGTSIMASVIQRGWTPGVRALVNYGYIMNASDLAVRNERNHLLRSVITGQLRCNKRAC